MAFVSMSVPYMRSAPRMSGSSRRPRRNRSSNNRSKVSRLDPILDDADIDQTDISTYVSCGKCFNSIMLAPASFESTPSLVVRCNVCDLQSTVTVDMLETISGEPFDADSWRIQQAINRAMRSKE